MSEINPYESPRAAEPMVVAELADPASGGVWRLGNLLVMHKQATLPDRCVKSNQPAYGRKLKRDLYWHHPLIRILPERARWAGGHSRHAGACRKDVRGTLSPGYLQRLPEGLLEPSFPAPLAKPDGRGL